MLQGLKNKPGLFAFCIAVLIVLFIWPMNVFLDPTLFPSFLIWSLINASLGAWLIRSNRPVKLNAISFVFLLFLSAELLGFIHSNNVGSGLLTWLGDAQVFIFVVLTSSIISDHDKALFTTQKMSVLALAGLSFWGFTEWVLALDGITMTHEATYSIRTNLGHRNLYSQFIILLGALSFPLVSKKGRWGVISSLILTVTLFLGFAALSRGAWVISAILLFAILIVRARRLNPKQLALWGSLIAAFAATFLFTIDGFFTIEHQFGSAAQLDTGTMRDRFLLMERSLTLFANDPFLGIGLGDWPVEIMQFDQSGMLTSGAEIYYQRAHNDIAQILAESGILAGFTYSVLIVLGLIYSIRAWLVDRSNQHLSIALGWLFFLWITLSNFPKERMPFLLLLGSLIIFTSAKSFSFRASRFVYVAIMAIALLSTSLFGWRLVSEHHFNGAITAREADDWQGYLEGINKAESAVFQFDDVSHPLSWHKAIAASNLKDRKSAKQELVEALEKNPYHPETYYTLAVMALQERYYELALGYTEKAIRYSPDFQDARVLQSAMLYRTSSLRKSFEAFLLADASEPRNNYQQIGTKLSIDSLYRLESKYEERRMKLSFQAFINTPDWAFDIIRKSSKNKLPFPDQAIMEACYYMLTHCEEDECEEAWRIKEKYIPNRKLNLPK